jgi:hypothetical protein
MTAPIQVLLAAGSPLTKPVVVLSQVSAGSAASPNIIIVSDGSITVAGNGSSCVPPRWYYPITAGVGASYWCKLTVNSGTAPDGGVNTVFALSSSRMYQWTQTVVGTKSCNATISICTDAGGTQVASSFSFNVTAQRTS